MKQTKLKQNCSVCHTAFNCGVTNSSQTCWCQQLPAIMPPSTDTNCLCPHCLEKTIATHIEKYIQTHPLKTLLTIAKPYYNPQHLNEHIDYYIEQSKYVFSAWYHLKRGTCCGNNCRHCPYKNRIETV